MGNNDKPLGMSGGVPAGYDAHRLRSALVEITSLRPLGNVETCKEPRKLVERMERIALLALDGKQVPIYPRATPTPPIEGRDADVERVEVVAKAMAEVAKVGPWDRMHEHAPRGWGESAGKSYWHRLARAALQALGERG